MTSATCRTPKTREEQNAYQNGVNRTRNSFHDRIAKIMRIAHSWREKARIGMDGARCDKCALWERGGKSTKWGYCNQDHDSAPELGSIWAERDGQPGFLISHENFACINFLRASEGGPTA